MNITITDQMNILRWGKIYAGSPDVWTTNQQREAINSAAEYFLMCVDTTEAASVMWWWAEGVRDYAKHMDDYDRLVEDLKRAAMRIDTQQYLIPMRG